MDYFILGLWGTTFLVVCVILFKVNAIIKYLKLIDKTYYKSIRDINTNCYANSVAVGHINEEFDSSINSILDRIAELTGTVTISGGKICKILDIIDAKDKAYITATDTLRSEQSVKTRKAKNSSHNKKATTIHKNKNNA